MLLDLQFYVYVLQIVACPFVLFLLAIVLSVFLRFKDSDQPFYLQTLLIAKRRYVHLIRYVIYVKFHGCQLIVTDSLTSLQHCLQMISSLMIVYYSCIQIVYFIRVGSMSFFVYTTHVQIVYFIRVGSTERFCVLLMSRQCICIRVGSMAVLVFLSSHVFALPH